MSLPAPKSSSAGPNGAGKGAAAADLGSLRIDRSQKGGGTQRPWGRWAALAAGVVVVAGALAAVLRTAGAEPRVQTVLVAAPTAAAQDDGAGEQVALNATGYVIASHAISLAPKVVGRVSWVGVERGDRVKKGQVLVRLEDDEYQARRMQARGQLDAAEARLAEMQNGSRPEEISRAKADHDQAMAQLENQQATLRRTRELAQQKVVSAQELDDAESACKAQEARASSLRHAYEMVRLGPRHEQIEAQKAVVEQAKGGLALAEADLANTVIKAPIDGTILQRNVEVGEYVTTGYSGEGGAKGYVVSLADLDDLRVQLDISQNDFAKVALHQPCWVTTDAYPDRRYEGSVVLTSPVANRQKATVEVEVRILNPDWRLKPEMNASVAFRSAPAGGDAPAPSPAAPAQDRAVRGPKKLTLATTIPASALRDGCVYLVVDGRAQRREVQVGAETSRGLEVVAGLVGGEEVITNPPAGLRDGQAVRIEEPTR